MPGLPVNTAARAAHHVAYSTASAASQYRDIVRDEPAPVVHLVGIAIYTVERATDRVHPPWRARAFRSKFLAFLAFLRCFDMIM